MTTITDTFTRADSTSTLGSTESPVLAWTADNGTWGISSNQAYVATQSGFDNRATISVGQANMDVSAVIVNASEDVGLLASYVDASNYYYAQVDAGGTVRVLRHQGGADTNLITGVVGWSSGSTLRLVTNDSGSGTQVTAYIGATQIYTGLDTTSGRPAGTRAGFRSGSGASPGAARFDSLSVVYTVPTGPTDTKPSTNVRVEIALGTDPDDPVPAFRDFSSRLDLVAGIGITRGRDDEFSQVQPGSCGLTLDNTDGALTMGNASGAYYPNVVPGKRMRVTYRVPGTSGNLLSANAASMETSIADWTTTSAFGYIAGVTAAQSSTRAVDGTKSLLVTWPTTGAGNTAIEYTPVSCVIGRTYIASMSVWVPATNNPVRCDVLLTAVSSASTVTGAWQRLSVTWTATQATHYVGVSTVGSTSGQQVWVDAVMVDEGTTLATFTTTAAPIEYRFDGYVEEWPVEWPGGSRYTQAQLSAHDLLSRIGSGRKLGTVIEETVRLGSNLRVYYPLGEAQDSVTAGDVAGFNIGQPLSIQTSTSGAGTGTLTFGTGTGPPTDGKPAVQAAPQTGVSPAGYFLAGAIEQAGGFFDLSFAVTWAGTLAAPTAFSDRILAELSDSSGAVRVWIGIDNSGKVTAALSDAFGLFPSLGLVSASAVNDGSTRKFVFTIPSAGGTARLYSNGVQVSSQSYTGTYLPNFTRLSVAGPRNGAANGLSGGTFSHVAVWNSDVSALAADISTASTTGFSGERSDQRIARIASWIGFPTARQVLDVGNSTSIAHVDPSGKAPLSYMQEVADTEQGVLYADTQGRLVFHNRARSYTVPSATASVDANLLGKEAKFVGNLFGVINEATGSRDGGADQSYSDPAAQTKTGWVLSADRKLLVTTDAEVTSAIQWLVNTHKTPQPRLINSTLDAYTSLADQAELRALDVDSRLDITGLPPQAPAATTVLRVNGYSEQISITGWDIAPSTSAFASVQAFVLDDTTYGDLDSSSVLVY